MQIFLAYIKKKYYFCPFFDNKVQMKNSKRYTLLLVLAFSALVWQPVWAAPKSVGMRALGDSLMNYTGFSKVWSPAVKVKSMRVDGDKITIETNAILSHVSWTPAKTKEVKQLVSKWLLGHKKGEVTIYTDKYEIEELITTCGAGTAEATGKKNLNERNIALWPSHGMYYNRERDMWIWQRATLWTTVEDLFSQEHVRLVRKMLENAGAKVYMPRPTVDNKEFGPSGMPRWAEGARYWLQKRGYSPAIWNLYGGDEYKDDMKCRGMWVNSLNTPIDLCVAFHTDGNDSGEDSTIIGTLCIYTAKNDDGKKELADGRDRYMTNRELGDYIQTQIVSDLQHIAPEWTRRQLREANYCESRVPDVPSIILELLSHKNMADMRYALDPSFRFASTRAIYKGILRYLCGKSAVVQPMPVTETSISTDGTIRWKAPIDSLEPSAKPKYYKVYIQENDGEWKSQKVTKTSLTIKMEPDVRYNCYVVAGNDGGTGFPGPTVSAYIASKEESESEGASQPATVFIIDAFDDVYGPEWFTDSTYAGIVPGSYACENRFTCAYIGEQWDFTRGSQWMDDDNCGWGSCHRDHAGELTVGNTHDYSVQHGRILQQMGISYCSSTKGLAFNPLSSTRPALIDLITGRQRVPLDSTLCQMLADHLDNGGRLLLSGEHLCSIDTAFTRRYLHFEPHATHATHSGKVMIEGQNCTVAMQPNAERICCPAAESIRPYGSDLNGQAVRIAWYFDSRCPAAVGYRSPLDSNPLILSYAFPLEATDKFDGLYTQSIQWLTSK